MSDNPPKSVSITNLMDLTGKMWPKWRLKKEGTHHFIWRCDSDLWFMTYHYQWVSKYLSRLVRHLIRKETYMYIKQRNRRLILAMVSMFHVEMYKSRVHRLDIKIDLVVKHDVYETTTQLTYQWHIDFMKRFSSVLAHTYFICQHLLPSWLIKQINKVNNGTICIGKTGFFKIFM